MRVKEKCDLASMRFCAPMLARVMGKFSDGTFQVVSKIDPATGGECRAFEVVLRHEGPALEVPDVGLVERMVARFSGNRLRRRPFPLRLNWCPWCGASLAERAREEVSADPKE